jgi:hypothetical protein
VKLQSWVVVAVAVLFAAACASKPVDMDEPRRVVGTENDVRVDAEVIGDTFQTSTVISLKYDVTNNRTTSIAVADLVPDANYDPDTRTVTINLGSEVPGKELLPRLIAIPPGGKKSFSGAAHVNLIMGETAVTPLTRFPNALQIKLNFLGDTKPFEQLIDIPERGVYNPKLADALFPTWLDRNESVITNSLPMRWSGPKEAPSPFPGRRRRP